MKKLKHNCKKEKLGRHVKNVTVKVYLKAKYGSTLPDWKFDAAPSVWCS